MNFPLLFCRLVLLGAEVALETHAWTFLSCSADCFFSEVYFAVETHEWTFLCCSAEWFFSEVNFVVETHEWTFHCCSADCFFKQGELNFALQDYHQALELDPTDAAIGARISVIHNEFGVNLYQDKNYVVSAATSFLGPNDFITFIFVVVRH